MRFLQSLEKRPLVNSEDLSTTSAKMGEIGVRGKAEKVNIVVSRFHRSGARSNRSYRQTGFSEEVQVTVPARNAGND